MPRWECEKDVLFGFTNCQLGAAIGGSSFRARPSNAVAMIGLHHVVRGRSAKPSMALVQSFHTMSADPRPVNTEGGHLIGLRLGGPDISENIVPMFSHVNRGSYAAAEAAIAAAYVAARGHGVVIELDYTGADPRIPSSIMLQHVEGLVINWGALTYAFAREIRSWPLANTPAAASRIDIDAATLAVLERARDAIAGGWTLESVSATAANWMRQGRLPAVANRPYALLDWLHFVGNQADFSTAATGSIVPGGAFSAAQRDLIQMVNRYMQPDGKRGECWSDVSDDPMQSALIGLGADSGIEVDHIIPAASNGPNAYSNAQIASSAYNRSKGRPTS